MWWWVGWVVRGRDAVGRVGRGASCVDDGRRLAFTCRPPQGVVGERDVDYIVERLRAVGYWAFWDIIDASEHGSPATRDRLYIIAVHGCRAGVSATQFGRDLLRSLKIDPIPIMAGFVIPDDEVRALFMRQAGLSAAQSRSTEPVDPLADPEKVWHDEHYTLFMEAGLDHPMIDAACAHINPQGLSRRMLEAAYYFDKAV